MPDAKQQGGDASAPLVVGFRQGALTGQFYGGAHALVEAALGAIDAAVGTALGVPLRLRISITPSLLWARAEHAHATVRNLTIAGLRVATVDIRGEDLGFSLWPPPARVRARRVCLEAEMTQDALDQWIRTSGLPMRLVLRDGSIRARTGIGGRRLGDVDLVVDLDEGKLRLRPVRVSVLGIPFSSVALLPSVFLPLPALPGRARMIGAEALNQSFRVAVEVRGMDEPVTPSNIRRAVEQLRRKTGGRG